MITFDNIFETIFLGGFVIGTVIRKLYARRRKGDRTAVRPKNWLDITLVGAAGAGLATPLLYLFTPFLDFADYQLPPTLCWLGWVGAGLFAAAILLLWRSHVNLAGQWSAIPQIKNDHNLVTTGIYKRIRHPMYAAHLLWAFAQVLLLHNWIAGPILLAAIIPFCLVRIPLEEKMMLKHFGHQYRSYINSTGRVIPPLLRSRSTKDLDST